MATSFMAILFMATLERFCCSSKPEVAELQFLTLKTQDFFPDECKNRDGPVSARI